MLLDGKPLKYPKGEVLARLKTNREKHVADYDTAMAGYRAERAKLYAALAYTLRQTGDVVPDNDSKKIEDAFTAAQTAWTRLHNLTRPQSYVDSYDRVIDQLGMTSDMHVDMDDKTFDSYMRDEWSWKQQFTAATKSYVDSAAGGLRLPH